MQSVIEEGNAVKTLKDILVSGGMGADNIKIVLSHIPTDRKRSVHDELASAAKAYGIYVAYDGYFFSV